LCHELNVTLTQIYWTLIVPFTVFVLFLEFFKMPEGNPNAGLILKRVVVSMILLWSFDSCVTLIAILGDGITEKIDGIKKLMDLMHEMSNRYDESWLNLLNAKETAMYVLSLCSYIVAYLGVFVANVLIHFVWAVLYVCSPLMILLYISPSTSYVTSNLYKGLINVMTWKILWSILAVMLLKLASSPEAVDWDNFLSAIMINLCIGLCMLFIPFATKSLIGDGMSSAASALAAVPLATTGKFIKNFAVKKGKEMGGFTLNKGKGGLSFAARPLTNRVDIAKKRVNKKVGELKKHFSKKDSNVL